MKDKNTGIGARMRLFAEAIFGSATKMENVYKGKNALQPYYNDTSAPGHPILKFLNENGCNINWLLTGEGDMLNTPPLFNEEEMNMLPLLADVPAGTGEINVYPDVQIIDLNYSPRTHFCVRIDPEMGISMEPFMHPGDVLVVSNRMNVVKDGDVVLAKYDDTRGAVKVFRQDLSLHNVVVLESYNNAIRPIIVDRKKLLAWKVVAIIKKS